MSFYFYILLKKIIIFGGGLMGLKIVYPEAKYFKEIMDSLSKIVDEVVLKATPEALTIRAMDPGKVALIEINLPQTVFLEYEVPQEASIGLSVNNLSKLIRGVKKGSRFAISLEEEFVYISIEYIGRREYRFRNLEIPVPEIPELNLTFNAKAQVLADTIKSVIKDAETVSETLEIEATTDNVLYFRSRGTSIIETKLTPGVGSLISLEVIEPSKSIYQIEFLKHVLGLTRIADVVSLKFSNDSPLELVFNISDGTVRYLLAPTVTLV